MAAAATDILSLDDAKLQLRIDGDDHDALVTTAIGAAVSYVAKRTRLPLIDHSRTAWFSEAPAKPETRMVIDDPYLTEITSWTYLTTTQDAHGDRDGTIDVSTLGRIETDHLGRTIINPPTDGWPEMDTSWERDVLVQKIVYTRGYTPADHEDLIKQAVILVMRDFYEQPDRETMNQSAEAVLAQLMDFR